MGNYDFSFQREDFLRKIGATWFVSYAYHEHIDKQHRNWEKVSTLPLRTSYYSKTRQYHAGWLRHIEFMSDAKLARNTLGLTAVEVKEMAHKVLNTIA